MNGAGSAEIRNPKAETRKGLIPARLLSSREGCAFGFRISSFLRVSGFGFRI